MVRSTKDYKIAFLAGLIEGDGNLYAYPNSQRRYVRIYTPDFSEVLWIVKTSKEIFGKLPIIGLDRPRGNKKLYLFRLEFHDNYSYDLFRKIDIVEMSDFELLSYLSGIIYAEGHIKVKRMNGRILFDSLEIEMKKKSSIESLTKTCQLLGIHLKSYNRLKRKHKVYYIRDRHLIEEIMNIVHLNWKWVKLLTSLNKIDLCMYALTRLYDHIILNHIVGKFFSNQPLTNKEILILKRMINIKLTSRTRTRASILYISPINNIDDVVELIKDLQHKDYIIDYMCYLRHNELSFFYKYCFKKYISS